MRTYIVNIRSDDHSPVVFAARWEGTAPSPEFAIAIAKRVKQAPPKCLATVREDKSVPYIPPVEVSTDWAVFGEGPVRKAMEVQHV